MSWFDIGKLGEASFITSSRRAASTNFFSGVAPLAGVTSRSFLSTLVVFFVVSFVFVCLSLSCVGFWPCVGSGASASLTGSAARTNFFRVVTPLAGITSLPTLVVFCVVSFAFVCLSLSCVVSWVFVATTFSSALVVVATVSSLSAVVRNVTSEL